VATAGGVARNLSTRQRRERLDSELAEPALSGSRQA